MKPTETPTARMPAPIARNRLREARRIGADTAGTVGEGAGSGGAPGVGEVSASSACYGGTGSCSSRTGSTARGVSPN